MAGTELFGQEEKNAVNDVMETGILFRYNHDEPRKGIWKSREFEEEIKKFTTAKYAHAVSSGSTAVALALAAAGIGFGDEVIVPPFTYIATIEAVIYTGAIPVFAEIDDTLNLSPEGIKAVLTNNTKAVLLVHMCGAIGHFDEIENICKENNILLIEDSAQALGASYKGKMAGTLGLIGTYSFDFFKIVTCGEGGVVVTNDEQMYKNVDMISDHGHDHIGNNRGMEGHPVLGINYRIGELNSAIGVAQMRKLNNILAIQKTVQQKLKMALSKHEQITFRNIPDENGDSYTFLSFMLPTEADTRALLAKFAEKGIDACQYWYDNQFHYWKNWQHLHNLSATNKLPLHALTIPQDYKTIKFPKSDDIISRNISMIVKLGWTDAELDMRIEKIHQALNEVFNSSVSSK